MKFKSVFLGLMLWNFEAQAAIDSETAVLTRGNIVITVEDVERYIRDNTPEDDRNIILQRKDIYKEIAENIYLIRSVSNEARIQSDILDEKQTEWALQLNSDRRLMQLYLAALTKREMAKIDWETMADEAYKAHKEKYKINATVKASHILISTSDRSANEALILAKQIREGLTADNFSDIAKEKSEDPSAAANNGNLGYFSKGKMVKPFEDAAFGMDVGTISEPVKTQFGYHIILLEDKKPETYQTFDQAKEGIIKQLQNSLFNEVSQRKMMEYRRGEDIVVNDQVLEDMKSKKFGFINLDSNK